MGTTDVIANHSAATPEAMLPHLRARSTIHAHLLRPVRLSRRRETTGHPGGPPRASTSRKRRKYLKQGCAGEDSPPNDLEGAQNETQCGRRRQGGALPEPNQRPAFQRGNGGERCGPHDTDKLRSATRHEFGRHESLAEQQEVCSKPRDKHPLTSSHGRQTDLQQNVGQWLDAGLARPSPICNVGGTEEASASPAVNAKNAQLLQSRRGNNRETSNEEESCKVVVARGTPPEGASRSWGVLGSSKRNGKISDLIVRPRRPLRSPPSPVDTTRYHVSLCMCECCRRERSRRPPGSSAPSTFKVVGSGPHLVLATLRARGFRRQGKRRATREAWRVLWSSQHLRSDAFRHLKLGQRINSFPRTYECTRKDALSKNMNRMRQVHGERHFDFVPRGYVLPAERETIRDAMAGSDEAWIVKPASSACGRGIFITKNFSDMPDKAWTGSEGKWIAQRYVEDPLLLDGLKFDLRLYVAVTSFRPLRIYIHEEGLCRLATEPYSSKTSSFGNRFVHLTNYSVNRRSSRYEPGSIGVDGDGGGISCKDAFFETSTTTASKGNTAVGNRLSIPPRAGTSASNTTPSADAMNSAESKAARGFGSVRQRAPCEGAHVIGVESDDHCHREGDVAGVGDRRCFDGRELQGEAAQSSEKCVRGTTSMPSRSVSKGATGSKWSLATLWKRLSGMGVDVPALRAEIHDVVIKTLVAIEVQVSSAVTLLGIPRGACFEMFGFDVLVDRNLKPHLLEVNFAPSLNTDSSLDLSVKSRVVADLLTLVGIRRGSGHQRSRRGSPRPSAAAREEGVRPERGRRKGRDEECSISAGEVGSGGEADNENWPRTRGEGSYRTRGSTAAGAIVMGGRDLETPPARAEASVRKAMASEGDDFCACACDRPATNGDERGDSGGRAGGRRRSRGNQRKVGEARKFPPAWNGRCVGGDRELPSAEEVAAVSAESASEMRRSGGFRMIFPMRGTAHKYFKFFDGPRPLERMLTATNKEEPSFADMSKGFKRYGRQYGRE
ncbi:unnamed protein product [Ascophyllum nodosum]